MILLDAIALGTAVGNWAIGIVVMIGISFLYNRGGKLVDKIDTVSDFVVKQVEKNGHLEEKIKALKDDQKNLESELKNEMTKLNNKLDSFIGEIRKDRKA